MTVKNKAQSAIEFIIIIGAVLFFFLMFMSLIGIQKAKDISEKRDLEVKDIALTVKDEINIAGEASDGYSREFTIPTKISGYIDYDISLAGTLVYIETADQKHAMAYPILNVTGRINIPDNKIRKENGTIYLNA